MHLVRNGEECNMHKIDWCQRGLQLEEVDTKSVGGPDLKPSMI